nr:ArdC-like ssDNA-binding domain-containing protein [Pectobacterium colocasium]
MKTFTLQDAGDICRLLTERLSVNADTVPWRQSVIRHGIPVHALSGQGFTGINVLLLWQSALQNGLISNRWLTGDDLRSLGGRIMPGQKPTTVVRYKPSLSLFRVINIEQCEGLSDMLQPGWPWPPSPVPGMERVGEWQFASQIPVLFSAQRPAVYLPDSDRIELPDSEQGNLDSLIALLVSATGHSTRLGRRCFTGSDVPELDEYLQESLLLLMWDVHFSLPWQGYILLVRRCGMVSWVQTRGYCLNLLLKQARRLIGWKNSGWPHCRSMMSSIGRDRQNIC